MTDFDLTLTRPLIFLPVLVASVAVVAIAAYVMSSAPEATTAIASPTASLLVAKTAGRDRTCETCGTTTIRRTRGRWIDGERVILIGGAAARALEVKQNVAL